jgi:hypothetical protein
MRGPFRTVILIFVATATLMTQVTLIAAAAEECRSRPGASAPISSHWYYRIDRFSQRRCWFLRSSESGTRRANSLRHREMNLSGPTEAEIPRQAETDESILIGSSSPQESAVVSDQQRPEESEVTELDAQGSEGLVPHQVTSISYRQPRVEEPSLQRGTNVDLAFLCGALATALLVAGGAFQVVGQIQQR